VNCGDSTPFCAAPIGPVCVTATGEVTVPYCEENNAVCNGFGLIPQCSNGNFAYCLFKSVVPFCSNQNYYPQCTNEGIPECGGG
jgi:hypothetical protein